MNNGWIKLHRKTLDNPIICKDAEYFAVWGYILLEATHKGHKALWKGEKIELNPGQLITGRKSISKKFNISESKVQRILKKFENEHQIEQQTSNQNRLITINNWHQYQQEKQQTEQPVNNDRTTSEQPVNTNKNEKNEKNEKNDKNIYTDFIKKFNEISGRKFGSEKKAERQFKARLKEGWTMQDFEIAIKNLYKSKHHRENNFKWATPELITRSDKLNMYANANEESSLNVAQKYKQKQGL